MKRNKGGRNKDSVSVEWYDMGLVKDRLTENNKWALLSSTDSIPKYQYLTLSVKS